MSLASDFRLYYLETYITFMQNGIKVPMYVTDVNFSGNEPDEDPYSMDHAHDLVFRGHPLIGSDGEYRLSDRTVSKSFDELCFEVPPLGYYQLRDGESIWLGFMPQRSAKKGFSLRKTNRGRNLSMNDCNNLLHKIFNDTRSYFQRNFIIEGSVLNYKGVTIGSVMREGSTGSPYELASLKGDAEYLREVIEEGLNA